MLKKLICTILILTLVVLPYFNILSIAQTGNIENINENLTVEYDATSVLVVIKHEYSEMWQKFTPEDFDSELIESVKDISSASPDNTSLKGYNMDKYRQILVLYLKEPSQDNVENLIDKLENNPIIECVEKNYSSYVEPIEETETNPETIAANLNNTETSTYNTTATSLSAFRVINDERYSEQYAVDLIQANRAWSVISNAGDVSVGVIDSGINSHHELSTSLNNTLSHNFTDEAGLTDNVGHGTHVAGIIASGGHNTDGIVGVAWRVNLINLKAYKARINSEGRTVGTTYYDWVAEAINYAADNDIQILNISGGAEASLTLWWAITNYSGLIVVSAGNTATESASESERTDITAPASYNDQNIIVVAACDSNDNIDAFSKYDDTDVDLFAPGTGVLSLAGTNDYVPLGGTSMAAPHVTGTAALILAINPDLSAKQVRSLILDNVDIKSSYNDKCVTGGRLNTFSAVLAASGNSVGDVNFDGSMTATDARLVLRYSASLETPSMLQRILSDYNFDGVVTAADAQAILSATANST